MPHGAMLRGTLLAYASIVPSLYSYVVMGGRAQALALRILYPTAHKKGKKDHIEEIS